MTDCQKPDDEQDDEQFESNEPSMLIEPAPTPHARGGMRVHVDDGFDNSDLRTLMSLATKKATEEE